MHDLESEIYHIWRPDLLGIVQQAIRQRSTVTVQCHWDLDRCNTADLSLFGRFIGITGQQTQYIVENYDLEASSSLPEAPECEYSFTVDMPIGDGGHLRMEYGGRGVILDQELEKNELPLGFLLRLSPPTRIRQMRRHDRYECPEKIFALPGLLLIDEAPTSRRKLLTLLGMYYQQKSRPKPVLVDISAGGVCLKSDDPGCQRFMGAEESYLFFFFSEKDPQPRYPHVYVGRKVGIFRSANSRHAGLRIRFMRELIWEDPEDDLRWIELDADGSKTISDMLAQCSENGES